MGCRPARPVTVRLVVDYRGASPGDVEAALWPPLQQTLCQPSEVTRVIGVSTQSRMEVFVTAEAGTDLQQLLDRVDKLMEQNLGQLPAGATVGMARAYHGSRVPPDYDIRQEPVLRIHLDQEKLASLGVSAAEAAQRIQEEKSSIVGTEGLAGLTVANQDGRLVPLTELARVELDYEPSHQVKTWSRGAAGSSGP